MKTNLPESRNRNLPPPPAAAADVKRRLQMPPPEEPGAGKQVLRSVLAMLVIGGLLLTGIWYYVHGTEQDVKLSEQLYASLRSRGAIVWESGGTSGLTAESEEAIADLRDLPRVLSVVKQAAGKFVPVIQPMESLGSGATTHQIVYSFAADSPPILEIRLRYDKPNDAFHFVGVSSPLTPSRKEYERMTKDATPGTPPAPTDPPGAAPRPESGKSPPSAGPAEKVSEPSGNPK